MAELPWSNDAIGKPRSENWEAFFGDGLFLRGRQIIDSRVIVKFGFLLALVVYQRIGFFNRLNVLAHLFDRLFAQIRWNNGDGLRQAFLG